MWLENNLSIDRAGQLIKKANVLSPDTAAYLDSLGWFYLVQGDFEKAEQELERAWELLLIECQEAGVEPIEPDAIILEHTAKAKAALGKYTEAIKTLHKALEAGSRKSGCSCLSQGTRSKRKCSEQRRCAGTSELTVYSQSRRAAVFSRKALSRIKPVASSWL